MIRYLVPGVYHVVSRLRTPRVMLFWLVNVLAVIAVVAVAASDLGWLDVVLVLMLALAAWQSVYEVGYLENDLVTTQRERQPTLRLDAAERHYLLRVYTPLVMGKLAVAAACVGLVAYLGDLRGLDLNLAAFVACVVGLRLVYRFHNGSRGRPAIASFGLLYVAKYLALPLLVVQPGSWALLLAALVPVPLTVLEYAALPRFGLQRLAAALEPLPHRRAQYYLVLTLVSGAIAWWVRAPWSLVVLGVATGLLLFRTATLIVLMLIGRSQARAGWKG